MRTLIVGVGALGGLLAARLQAAGAPVRLATRDRESAARLRAAGLRVTGRGGAVEVAAPPAAATDDYRDPAFDLLVLATKAREAVDLAPRLAGLLAPGGVLLPIQNGGVAELIGARLGAGRVLGGLSNLGAAWVGPGAWEQRNDGHLLVGELAGGPSERAERVRAWLGQGVEVRTTANLPGAVWSKLLVNCATTTLGAVAGGTLRQVLAAPGGRALFEAAYDEALAVARACGARPERMLVEPVPPPRPGAAYEAWVGEMVRGYGDARPSMLQDLERGRPTEIDFVNGHVVARGQAAGVAAPVNRAVVEVIRALSRGEGRPEPAQLQRVLRLAAAPTRPASP